MSLRAYVDTNVFIDLFEDRDSAAYEFFMKAIRCSYIISLSGHTLRELSRRAEESEILRFLSFLETHHKLEQNNVEREDILRSESIAHQGKTHHADALHIAIAERVRADIIVTSNTKDFVGATTILVRKAREC